MSVSIQTKNQHLIWRAAFGPVLENVAQFNQISTNELYTLLKTNTTKKTERFTIAKNMYDGFFKGVQDLGKVQQLTQEQKKQMRKQSIEDLQNLNLTWLDEMVNTDDQLREKMSFFWHGHFACRVINIYFQQELLHIIRENALGNFGDLLRAVSKSAAMISFLNNQQNKKQHPNENFAREVMELFTMGRGNYSEQDVKEAARAFTGWGFGMQGEFQERAFLHDTGQKTFLHKSGNFNGDDIINMILEQKSTAYFITKKIYLFFVNDEPNETIIQSLATDFYANNYDLQKLLDSIFLSNWFYDEKNIGAKIKSPIELIAGIRRILPMDIHTPEYQLLFERSLGQVLFYPPNVAGWPGGKNWIDSSTLMVRLRLAQIMAESDTFSIQPKDDDDLMMGMEKIKNKKDFNNFQATIQWDLLAKKMDKVGRENMYEQLQGFLFQTTSTVNPLVVKRYTNDSSKENYIKTCMIQLMSMPEYQVC